MLDVQAYAKINLSLEILGKRPDGYHELISVMQTISLSDSLRVFRGDSIDVRCDDPAIPVDDNLVLRAAKRLRANRAGTLGCTMDLVKKTPIGAGLGGGSSDAAATLVALSRLWELDVSCDEFLALAGDLGADVPFFLYAGTAVVEGRGEIVTSLPDVPEQSYLLVKPPISVSTATVFSQLDSRSWSDGGTSRKIAATIRGGGAPSFGVNGLQETLFRLYPAARSCFEAVSQMARGRAIVSGSGPTIVAQFDSGASAEIAAIALKKYGYWTTIASSCTPPGWQTPCR